MMVFVGAVFLVQGVNDQANAAKAQGKNKSRKHGMPPLDNDLVQQYKRDPS
jgi:NAD/NADP transhydrogenase beta subunit